MDVVTLARSQWDRLLATAALAAGVVVLVVGWRGVSGTPYPAEQLPYIISGGLGGLFLLGVSAALWLSADLHDEWRKLDRIEQAIRSAELASDQVSSLDQPENESPRESDRALQASPAEFEYERTGRLPRVAPESAQ